MHGIPFKVKGLQHIGDECSLPEITVGRPFMGNRGSESQGFLHKYYFVLEEKSKVINVLFLLNETAASSMVKAIPWATGRAWK